MSIILRVNKVESSEGDRSSKYERTNEQVNANLFWYAKESHYQRFKIFILFIDLNESYMLQIYFAKTARTTLWIPVLFDRVLNRPLTTFFVVPITLIKREQSWATLKILLKTFLLPIILEPQKCFCLAFSHLLILYRIWKVQSPKHLFTLPF